MYYVNLISAALDLSTRVSRIIFGLSIHWTGPLDWTIGLGLWDLRMRKHECAFIRTYFVCLHHVPDAIFSIRVVAVLCVVFLC